MGLLDWLKRGRGDGRKPGGWPEPKVVRGLEEGSPFVAVELGNGTVLMMDRDTYDYRYGESDLPPPAQRDLNSLLPRVTRLRALAGGMTRGEAAPSPSLLDTSDPAAIQALRACFAIDEDPATFGHCSCLGGPTLELFSGAERIATIGLQHGKAIRWGHWKHDACLLDGRRLNGWLTSHGVDPDLLDLLFQNPFGFTGGRVPGARPEPLSTAEQRVFLAEILAQRGEADTALALCDAVLADHPGLGKAHATRGQILFGRGDFEDCLAEFTAAIDDGLQEADIHFARAVALDNVGRPLDALADLDDALAIDPSHANSYNSRGLIRLKLGQFDDAQADIDTAIGLAPDWILPQVNHAQLAQFRGDQDAAVASYTTLIDRLRAKTDPKAKTLLAKMLWNRGQSLHALGESSRAESDLREAVRLLPSLADPSAGE